MGQVVGAPHALGEKDPHLQISVEGLPALVCCLPGAPAPSTALGTPHCFSAELQLKASASGVWLHLRHQADSWSPSPTSGLKIKH